MPVVEHEARGLKQRLNVFEMLETCKKSHLYQLNKVIGALDGDHVFRVEPLGIQVWVDDVVHASTSFHLIIDPPRKHYTGGRHNTGQLRFRPAVDGRGEVQLDKLVCSTSL